MVICGEWRMDKCDAEKKALTVEEGAVSIGEECWIFNEEVERQAGTYTYCEYVQIKGEFEALTVPNSVTTIMERAFAGHSGLKGLSILSGVTEIGKNAFKGCGSLPYVIAPKVALSSIADPESKEKLAMGYLLHSELFEETLAREYRLYISRQRKKMLALAQKHSLSDAIKKLNPASAEASSLGSAKKKLNAAEAVFQLERKILIGTKQEIAETIKTNRPIEMTARALGLACRCRDSGIVELLLREGFQFDIPDHALMIKYGAEYAPSGKKFPADYALLLVVDNIWNKYLFGYMDRQYNRKEAKRVFSEFLKTDKDVSSYSDELMPAPPSVRVGNLKLLAQYEALSQQRKNRLLYFAILEEQKELADALQSLGATIDAPWLISDADHSECISECNQYLDAMSGMKESQRRRVLFAFAEELQKTGKQLYVSEPIYSGLGGYRSASIAALLFERGDTSTINKKKLLQTIVQVGKAGILAAAVNHGLIKTPKLRDELIRLATDCKKTEIVALLLDYKNKTADPKKEARAADAAQRKSLTASPYSVAELKKRWSYKKKDDGTILITSYKGEEETVTVPDMIGGAKVTELDKSVFAPWVFFSSRSNRISNKEARERIKCIIIPDGIFGIGSEAFCGCRSLTSVTLPEGLKSIRNGAFKGCSSLTSINLPEGVTSIGDNAFFECSSLTSINLPEGVTSIGDNAFFGCTKLTDITLPESVTGVGGSAFSGCRGLADSEGFVVIHRILFDYFGTAENALIPEGVTAVSHGVFRNNDHLLGITLPDSVSSIGAYAFFGCKNLSCISLPSGVNEILYSAFRDCPNLTIHAPAGSFAEQYAKEHNIPFVAE